MALNEKTVVWKDDAAPELRAICRTPEQTCNFTWLNFSAHAGTHIDAPYYLFSSSWTADQVPLDRLMGTCKVIDLSYIEDTITLADIKYHEITQKKILLKTKNSFDASGEYNPQHVDIDPDAARYLVEQGVHTVGYDYQSFERGGATEIHRIFLEKNITLIDNLVLGHVAAGIYKLIALPLKVTGIDAAPVRAILVKETEQ